MSLLLDALKRAEQEKHTRNGERPPTPPRDAVALAPAAANSPTGALELQPLGGAPAAPPLAAARSESAAHAAQTVFMAKTARDDAGAGRGMLWATVGVIIVVVAAAGAYVWYSLRMLTPQLVAANTVRPPAAPTPPPASAGMTVGELPPGGGSPMPGLAAVAPSTPAATPAAVTPVPNTRQALAEELFKEPPAAPASQSAAAPEPLLSRAPQPAPRIPADLTQGYEALRAGDVGTARRAYQAALERDPRGIDAHLGMATLEARAGNRPAATSHYRRVLEADPQNATALAGLASVADSRAENLEGLLREDIARQPQSAPLYLALGNVYAAQGRWHDAQGAYFEAHRLDPANADIAYNLAISLDHIGQPRLAAEHYRRALEAARGRPVQFEPAQVERRLAELALR